MENYRRLLAILITLGTASIASPQLLPREKELFEQTLSIGNLTDRDLEWDRRPFRDQWMMPLVSEAIDHPLVAADHLMSIEDRLCSSSIPDMLKLLESEAFGTKAPIESPAPTPEDAIDLPVTIRTPIAKLAAQIAWANGEIRSSTQDITPEQQRALVESLPFYCIESDEVKFDFVKSQPLPWSEVLALMKKVDLVRIRAAASVLSRAVSDCTGALRGQRADIPSIITTRINGIQVEVGGTGDDTHTSTNSLLCIDLGGNDTYLGRMGAGVRYAAISIDMGGDDRYETKDLSTGAAALGIGIHYDVEGMDTYALGNLSGGAALGGVGILVDGVGNDHYRCKTLGEGFAEFGVGILVDLSGDDYYDAGAYAQGAAKTQGVGLLVDRLGRDVYRAGGLMLNSPLFADVYYSFAQGFGAGYREDTGGTSGGIGILCDAAGDDNYLSESYAQAASYWYALGTLYDRSGHDTYAGYHYAQSSAMHMCAAYLFDLAGDDQYGMKFGASHAIGHDYGVAFFLDRKGNDTYFAKDSTPGVGNANGLGIFIDDEGEDRYQGPVGRGNGARGTGSLGIFVDGNGQDAYREGLADGQVALSDSWGIGFDAATTTSGPAPANNSTQARPTPGSIPLPSESELATIYTKATQWGVGTAVQEVEQNVAKLVGIGMPAVNWMLGTKLGSASRLEMRAFVEVIRDCGPAAREALALKVLKGTPDEKRVGLQIAVDGVFTEVGPAIAPMLSDPRLTLQACRAAGVLKSKESVNELMTLCARKDLVGVAAIVSLAQIGDESAYTTAEALVAQGTLPVRKAGIQLIAKFPARALVSAKSMLLQGDERVQRIGIEILGAIHTEEALNELGTRLLDPQPGVRAQTLLALSGQCPPDFRLTFMSLRNDPDPIVRAVAQRVDPGR